ncbi:macrolide ABC transporter ATP-binding protein [Bacillus sp. FJAT-27264]|uniref:ABC transporter ATP-binding protein n=1 Tax=Paenibacillus sp. (strain DSM 101736 / FJAT-27264) TaxID=1850362 RepID=UPI000807B5FE|nr:ABC transporter ATP-binding protein [Bacillus sp. FJAT-27264]OBZ14646.1 macrolide ABC transporter ATP-binding protein [Bacillus sp. FJAT-27264]
MSYIKFEHVAKTYQTGEVLVKAANDVNLSIQKGEFTVILGPSGAGKTTILNLLGGMDSLTEGSITVDNVCISSFTKSQLTNYRRNQVGFVFQFYNLVPNLTALENVALASQVCENPLDAGEMLMKVGLQHRMHNFPSQLSGGEQQRVAIARALAKNPKLILCDEPTGALDSVTGKQVMQVLWDVSKQLGQTLVIVTHNAEIAKAAQKMIHMHNGSVKEMVIQSRPLGLEELVW